MPKEQAFHLSAQQLRVTAGSGRSLLLADVSVPLTDEALHTRLAGLITDHEILRTAFPEAGVRKSGIQIPLMLAPPPQVITTQHARDDDVLPTAERLAAEQSLNLAEGRCLTVISVRGPARHVLALIASALVADGHSLVLILDQLVNSSHSTTPVRYVAYASWQEEQRLQHQDDTWYDHLDRTALKGLLDATLSLVTASGRDMSRRSVPVNGLAALTRDLDDPSRVRAAWTAFLANQTAADHVLLGCVTTGRDIDGLDSAVGPYARMLPLVIDVAAGRTLDHVATAGRRDPDLLAEMAHRFDWRRLGERLDQRRFVFGFAQQQYPPVTGASIIRIDAWPEEFTLALSVRATAGGMALELVHDRCRVHDRYADALAAHFSAFLSAAMMSSNVPINELSVAADDNLTEGSVVTTSRKQDEPIPVLDRIREHAIRNPDVPAIRDTLGTMSYCDLVTQAEALADELRRAGATVGSAVLALVGRNRRYPVIALATAILGAAFVPLDPINATARVRDAATDFLADIAVVEPATARQVPTGITTLVVADDGRVAVCDQVPLAPSLEPLPDGTCYVVYTSGSTGTPKPVAVSYTNLAAYVDALTTTLGLRASDRIMHTAPLGFSSSIRQTLVVLAAGAMIVMASDAELRDPAELLKKVAKEQVTVLDLVPALWRRVTDAAENHADLRHAICSQLRLLLSASESLSASTAAAIATLAGPQASVINMYGQTETTGIVATSAIASGPTMADVVPLGCPLPGVTIALLDRAGRPVPVGSRGTIHVVGPTVALGYHARAAETGERFRSVAIHGRRAVAYDTGDIGIVGPDGVLHFQGRRDDQIKIRGFRVELGEVDAGLNMHPAVKDAAAVAIPAGEDHELVGFIVPRRDQRPTHTDLVSFLSERIASYLIPSRFRTVTVLPLLSNGKIDRRTLAEAADDDRAVRLGFVAPRTGTERTLAAIWAEILDRDEVGVTDNFFELGGHSLRGIDMLTKVMRHFGVVVPWTAVFETPTISGLAVRIDALAAAGRVTTSR